MISAVLKFAEVMIETSSDCPIVSLGLSVSLRVIGGDNIASDTKFLTDCFQEI